MVKTRPKLFFGNDIPVRVSCERLFNQLATRLIGDWQKSVVCRGNCYVAAIVRGEYLHVLDNIYTMLWHDARVGLSVPGPGRL